MYGVNKIYQSFITYAQINKEISQKGVPTAHHTPKQRL
jgi:hypothetical protein